MEQSLKILKENNIRVTQQRLEIYRLFLKRDKYLTAEEIYNGIKLRIPAISLATVYSIVDMLKEKGLVKQIRIRHNKSCYGTSKDFHHHFLCKYCSKIFDIGLLPCPTLNKGEVAGHLIEELQGYFYGTCKECLKKIGGENV